MVVMRLYLCEKPSQAKDIAAALGAKRRGDGCWLGTDVTVTWCIGHLLETAPPDAYDARYKRWVLASISTGVCRCEVRCVLPFMKTA